MFREVRKKRQALSKEQCEEILCRSTSGVLALSDENGYPYAVPLSYLYQNGKIYFHGSKIGHKMDCLSFCNRASFCVVDRDQVVPEEYTSYFRSVIVFGTIRIMENENEKRRAIEQLAIRYAPDNTRERLDSAIAAEWNALCMLEMTVEHMTGKEALELVQG